jgi:hypothetical protein
MIPSRTSRAPRKSRLLPGLAATAVMTSGLALGIAPAHAGVTVTPWQLGIDSTVSTVLSADGSQVYALGTVSDQDGNATFLLDTVNTTSGAVTGKTLDLPGQRTEVDGVETQVDDLVVSPDGTVFASGYVDDLNDENPASGTLWKIAPNSTSAEPTAIAGLSEGSALALTDGVLVVGGSDENYAPMVVEGPVASFGSGETPVAHALPVDESTTGASIDEVAVTATDRSVWVAGRTYSGPFDAQTTSDVLWHVTAEGSASAPLALAHPMISLTADAGTAYVGEGSWDENSNFTAEGVQAFPADGGSVAAYSLDGEYPSQLRMSPDGTKVVGVGNSGAFAFEPATTKDLIYTYGAGTINDLAFSATKAYAVVFGYTNYAPNGTMFVQAIDLPWVLQPTTVDPTPTPPAPVVTHPTPAPPAPHLTPAEQKVAKAQAKVTKTTSAIAQAKAQARAAKQAHDKATAKKLAKKITKLKQQLKQQKAAVAKAKKAAKKAAKKKH